MSVPASRKRLALLALVIPLLLAAACTGGEPDKPGSGKDETPPADSGLVVTPGPVTEGTEIAPPVDTTAGTVIFEEELTLNAFNTTPLDMSFQSQRDSVFRVDSQLTAGVMDYNLEILNASGGVIAHLEARAGNADLVIREYTTPFTGSYAVRVQPLSGGGKVKVTVTTLDASSGGGAIDDLPGSMTGSFYDAGVYHTYRFMLESGSPVTIGAYGAYRGLPDTAMILFGPDGAVVDSVDDIQPPNDLNAVLLGFTPQVSGEYTAVVNPVARSLGDYTMRIEPGSDLVPVVGDPDILVNSEYRARFVDGDVLDLTFDGTMGDAISVDISDVDNGLMVDAYIYSPFGQIIAYAAADTTNTGRDQLISELQLPYSGRYLLQLIPRGEGEASFTILPIDPAELTGGGIFSDETVSTRQGKFDAANAFHVYQFNAEAGDLVTLRINSTTQRGTLDIGFALISPDGMQVMFVDDMMGGTDKDPALVDYEIGTAGTYTVIVYALADGFGTYEFSFSRR